MTRGNKEMVMDYLRHQPDICTEGLRENLEINQNSWHRRECKHYNLTITFLYTQLSRIALGFYLNLRWIEAHIIKYLVH
jgi:hypothetical protein